MTLQNTQTVLAPIYPRKGNSFSPASLDKLDAANGKLLSSIEKKHLHNVQTSPYTDQYVVSVGSIFDDKKTHIVSEGRLIETDKPEAQASFSRDGSRIALTTPTRVWVVDAHTGQEIFGEEMHVRDQVALSPDGKRLAVPTRESKKHLNDSTGWGVYLKPMLEVFDLDKKASLLRHEGEFLNLEFAKDGSLFCSKEDELIKYKPKRDSLVQAVLSGFQNQTTAWATQPLHSSISSIAVSPDGSKIAVQSNSVKSSEVGIVDAKSGELLRAAETPSGRLAKDSLAWSPDGSKLVCALTEIGRCSIPVFSSETLKPLQQLEQKQDFCDLAFRPDGQLVALTDEYLGATTVLTLDADLSKQTSQRLYGVQLGNNSSRLNNQGDPVFISQPEESKIETIKTEEWLKLYSETLEKSRKSDDSLGDLDKKPGAVRFQFPEGGSSVVKITGSELASERPALNYEKVTDEAKFDETLPYTVQTFQSDGMQLFASNSVVEPKEFSWSFGGVETRWDYQINLQTGQLIKQDYSVNTSH